MKQKLILDADGVFLAESPFWDAALLGALASVDLHELAASRWYDLRQIAFDPLGLQRITKSIGCNSNWDMAAVLAVALQEPACFARVGQCLSDDAVEEALIVLRAAAMRVTATAREDQPVTDPLMAVGIDRNDSFYRKIAALCGQALDGELMVGLDRDTALLSEPLETTRACFERLVASGFTLAVCTGRPRQQIVSAIEANRLEDLLALDEVTSATEVWETERSTGLRALGKPHWYAPVRAAVGAAAALRLLRVGTAANPSSRLATDSVYIGDGWSDFQAVGNAREQGVLLRYIHISSGVTSEEQDEVIGAQDFTIAVVSRLSDAPPLLEVVNA